MSGNTQQSSDLVKITVGEISVEVGERATVLVRVEVKKGYHIQANKVSQEYLIPSTIEIEANKDIIIEEKTFPHSKMLTLEGFGEPLNVYDGNVDIQVGFKVGENCGKGKNTLKAKLHFQACDARSCLSPRTLDFLIPIEVL
jgi:hypothetical protein